MEPVPPAGTRTAEDVMFRVSCVATRARRFVNPQNRNRDVPFQKLVDAQGKEEGDEMKDQEL